MRHIVKAASVLPVLVLIFALAPGSASAAPPPGEPCQGQASYPWMGSWLTQEVTVPSLEQPNGVEQYRGYVRRPANLSVFSGRRPIVVLQHGLGGDRCKLSWIARDLAGHGYITITTTAPKEKKASRSFANIRDAMRSAVSFARSTANPFTAVTDPDRLVLGGIGYGAQAASAIQGDPLLGSDAIIALDNLSALTRGGRGSSSGCKDKAGQPVTPRVPALGIAPDVVCKDEPKVDVAGLKLPGWLTWRLAEVPAMELVMKGFQPGDLGGGGDEGQRRLLSHYTRAWLGRWIGGRQSAVKQLLAKTVEGVPTADILSTRFLSAAYIPGRIDSGDFRGWLLADRKPPQTKNTGGPDKGSKVSARKLRRKGVLFRFRANEPATFECRVDSGAWKPCAPPARVQRGFEPGRHTFRVRATDSAGNREKRSAKWDFRVVR